MSAETVDANPDAPQEASTSANADVGQSSSSGLSDPPPADSEPPADNEALPEASTTAEGDINGNPPKVADSVQPSEHNAAPAQPVNGKPSHSADLQVADRDESLVPIEPINATENKSTDRADASGVTLAARRTSSGNSNGNGIGEVKAEEKTSTVTPAPAGRGNARGRPRGRGRGGGRGGKRKREDRDDDDSDSSEVYTPIATKTKSGRSIQKPTTFVPPPAPSPTTGNKPKRKFNRRNPEAAVCKVCLRGTSPASNMIVFCDGCNTPYHRFCHHPPIDQSVIDEVDKEWYCKQCEQERVLPVPEAEIADFVAAPGASVEQRQRYFASLPQGLLVTLLTKATTLHPDLPVFAPDFTVRSTTATQPAQTATNGHGHPTAIQPQTQYRPDVHNFQQPPVPMYPQPQSLPGIPIGPQPMPNAQYMQPPMHDHPVPEGHPPNYPRPGYGLMRAVHQQQPEMQWMLDEPDRHDVFLHIHQVDQRAANASMGNSGMEGVGGGGA